MLDWKNVTKVCLAMGLLALGGPALTGCEPVKRFDVPEHQRKKKLRFKRYRVKTKIRLPRYDSIPSWSMIADVQRSAIFQPEPVKLQGQLWMRTGSSRLFDFYFQHKNLMAGRTLSRVGDQVARFVSVWLKKAFAQRVHVLIVPKFVRSKPAVAASKPATKPTSRSSLQAKKERTYLGVPTLGTPQITIFSGADNDTKLSDYGLVGELVQASVRLLLSGGTAVRPELFWRTLAIPTYFDLRGTGAMVSRSYNRTMMPKFRELLKQVGFPKVSSLQRWIKHYKEFTPLAQKRIVEASSSLLGFLEDAYGRRVLVLVLRELASRPKASFAQCVKAVIGKPLSQLWREWKQYYDSLRWRRNLLFKL